MKKYLFLLFIIIPFLSGCEKIQELTKVDFPFSQSVTIPPIPIVGIPLTVSTPDMEANVDSILNAYNFETKNIDGVTLKVAVCYEMRNAQLFLEQVKDGTCEYDFIEVMSCPGGCVGGAGQPALNIANLEDRIRALESADSRATTRFCHENPEVISIYKEFLGKPGGPVAEQYLHTHYFDKSDLLIPVLEERQPEPVM